MSTNSAGAEALNALSRFLIEGVTLGDTLQRIVELSTTAVTGADFAGISMQDLHGKPCTPVYSDPRSPAIDQAQYAAERGPCVDAWQTGEIVLCNDLGAEQQRFPEFAQAAMEHGVHSTLALPLVADGAVVGALNLYAAPVGAFSDSDRKAGRDFALTAAAVLVNARAYRGALELSENLSKAMESRAVIEQAKGMLMARDDSLDADGAFDILRRASQRENVKLRDIAQRIVSRVTPSETV